MYELIVRTKRHKRAQSMIVSAPIIINYLENVNLVIIFERLRSNTFAFRLLIGGVAATNQPASA
jgi:hypothetical protein